MSGGSGEGAGGPREVGSGGTGRPDATLPPATQRHRAGFGTPRGPGGSGEPGEPGAGTVQASVIGAIGGVRGMVDSSIPTIAFVIVNAESGLTPAIVVAVAAAAVLVAVRAVRREPVAQAFSGLLGVVFAAFIASRMHRAEGYFLPGIIRNCVLTAVGLGSVLVRRPLAGYVMAMFEPAYRAWRQTPDLWRAAMRATWIWIAVFAVRGGVQTLLYLQGRTGWLAVANIALGLPVFGLALLATFAVVRGIAPEHAAEAAARRAGPLVPAPGPGPGPAAASDERGDRTTGRTPRTGITGATEPSEPNGGHEAHPPGYLGYPGYLRRPSVTARRPGAPPVPPPP